MPVASIFLVMALLMADSTPRGPAVQQYYFETTNESQIWVDLTPHPDEAPPGVSGLNVTVRFSGRQLKSAPATATFTAFSNDANFPFRARTTTLRMTTTDGRVHDLSAIGTEVTLTPPCSDDTCSMTDRSGRLSVRVPFDELRQLATSPTLAVSAMGFDSELSSEQVDALRRLLELIEQRPTLAVPR